MKNPIAIILRTIHLGSARRVVTLGIDGNSPADDFLDQLQTSNPQGYDALYARLRAVAERDRYENMLTFRSLGDGLYEFKTKKSGLLLFAFYDQIEGMEPQLIVAASGTAKSKRQSADISRARQLRECYLTGKKLPNTTIEIKELDS